MADPEATFTFIDLFAGLGGFHVALEDLGGIGVFAAEWEPALYGLYQHNFPDTKIWSDVNELDSAETIDLQVPDHTLLAAGFPCQPFSKAGEQLGFSHTLQGQLFFKVLDILLTKKPRRFILENVPNILRHKRGETLETMLAELEQAGYSVAWKKYSPHQFGVPQIRERAYFVGSLDGLDDFEWPEPTHTTTDIRSVLRHDETVKRPIPAQTSTAIDMWDDFLRRAPSAVKLPSFPIWSMEFRATYPFENATPAALWEEKGPAALHSYMGSFGFGLDADQEVQYARLPSYARRVSDYSFPLWKQDFIRQNREFFWRNRRWIEPWIDEWRPWNLPQSLQKFEWNVQGGERRIDQYVIQVRASGIRAKRTATAPSLIAMTSTQVPILGKAIAGTRRYMTPAECAGLQSLERITLPASETAAYRALGNAVNASVVRAIAKPLIQGLSSCRSDVEASELAA